MKKIIMFAVAAMLTVSAFAKPGDCAKCAKCTKGKCTTECHSRCTAAKCAAGVCK